MIELLDKIMGAMFPRNYTCDICGREVFKNSNLCDDCKELVTLNDQHTCPVCGRKTNVDQLCLECKDYAPAFKKAISALVYKQGVITLVHKYKNDNGYLKEYFADLIAPKCDDFDGADCLVCVPMTKKSEARRGYNQSEILAKALAKRLKLPYIKGAVRKVRQTPPQKTLSRREREKNLEGCFKADKRLVKGRTPILIDDVLTTGATANAVCEALKAAGAKTVYFASIASVEYDKPL
jgi:ComF family protein